MNISETTRKKLVRRLQKDLDMDCSCVETNELLDELDPRELQDDEIKELVEQAKALKMKVLIRKPVEYYYDLETGELFEENDAIPSVYVARDLEDENGHGEDLGDLEYGTEIRAYIQQFREKGEQ